MKFVHNPKLDKYIEKILEENELNLSTSDIFSELIGNREITTVQEIEALKKNSNYLDKDILASKICDYLDIDLSFEDNESIFTTYVTNLIEELNIDKYVNNPYYQKFKDLNIKDGQYQLIYDSYSPYELFAYKDMELFPNSYIEKNSVAYFKTPFKFLALNKNNVTWMSITPNEIETMEKYINIVKGDITVFGLGLGYFIYMISNKKEVNKITVIEYDETIIKLFNNHLINKFEHKEKINIIKCDALDYIKQENRSDFAFVDLWHNTIDGLEIYLKFKKSEYLSPNCHYFYWLESSFYMLLRRLMMTLIQEQLEGYDSTNYKKAESYLDKVINKYYLATKNLTITSETELENLLSDKTLLRLILND